MLVLSEPRVLEHTHLRDHGKKVVWAIVAVHRSSVESWICEAYGAVYTGSPPGLPRQHPAMKCNEQRRPHSPKGARPSPGTLCVRCCVLFFSFSFSLSLSRALARNVNRTPWSSLPAKGEMVAALMPKKAARRG